MTMNWLMTVQEAGTSSPKTPNWPAGVEFDLTPRWISPDPGIGNEPPPNPSRFGTLRRWPSVVEIRRPDGTQVSAELLLRLVHINFVPELLVERDAAGRMRSYWLYQVVLSGVSMAEVPLGSEIWGEVTDEDIQASKDPGIDPLR